MDNKIYYYKTIYEEIEEEIIFLTKSILFCDEQLNVYSSKIASLILRCGAEVEALYKDIYKEEISTEIPASFGLCVKSVSEKYLLEQKKVHISNIGIFFNKQENKLFCPFKSGNYFYDSFCALKHDLGSNIYKANIKTLLMVAAAMFILVYFYEGRNTHVSLINISDYYGMLVKSKIFRLPIACLTCGSNMLLTVDGVLEKEFKELETCASVVLIHSGKSPIEFERIKEKVLEHNISLTGDTIPLGINQLEYVEKNFTNGDTQAASIMLSQIYGVPKLDYKYRVVNNFGKIDQSTILRIYNESLYYKFGLIYS